MSMGLLMLIACSVIVARHARELGRSSGLWVVLLWLSCFAGAYLCGQLALMVLPAESLRTEAQARSALVVPMIVGMVLGVVAVVFAVNRPPSRPD